MDIQFATEMLSFGFQKNYDVAVLCSGDQDFLPAIERIKDLEMFVYVVASEVYAQ